SFDANASHYNGLCDSRGVSTAADDWDRPEGIGDANGNTWPSPDEAIASDGPATTGQDQPRRTGVAVTRARWPRVRPSSADRDARRGRSEAPSPIGRMRSPPVDGLTDRTCPEATH